MVNLLQENPANINDYHIIMTDIQLIHKAPLPSLTNENSLYITDDLSHTDYNKYVYSSIDFLYNVIFYIPTIKY